MFDGTDGAQFLSPPHTHSNTRDGRLRQRSTLFQPPAGSAPFLAHPDTGENHVAAMRYRIDFLMKHNITFSLAPGFFPFTLAQHKYAQRKESIRTRKKVKHPAIYQHWISKSGPVSPDCWDIASYESTFIYLFRM